MASPEMDRFKAFATFPELRTKRLILREVTLDDADWYFEHFSRTEIVHGQGFPAPKSMREAKEELRLYFIDLFGDRNGFRWGIQPKGGETLIGSCGYYKWLKPEGRQAEMGYDLDPKYWGEGIMKEALTAIIDFGFRRMNLNRIEVLVMPRNKRSIGLLGTLGFEGEGVLREHGVDEHMKPTDDILFSMLRKDWTLSSRRRGTSLCRMPQSRRKRD